MIGGNEIEHEIRVRDLYLRGVDDHVPASQLI